MLNRYKVLILFIIFLSGCQIQEDNLQKDNYNPKAAAYNVQLGLAYLQRGNRQRAKQKLLMAIAEAPDSSSANDALAYYFENTQDIQQAEYYYQRAIQLDSRSGSALNNYGAFLCRQAQYDKANEYFLRAIAEPQYLNTALAYENAGLCALAANRKKEAKYYFQKALAEDPSLQQSENELKKMALC